MGGIELHLRDLALALRANGVDARIVTTTRGEAVVDGVPVHRVSAVLAPGAGFALSPMLPSAIGRVLAEERFDLVHAHASVVSPAAYAGLVAAARAELPAVLTFHSMLYRSSMLLAASDGALGWSRKVVLTAVSSVVAAQAARWMPGASVGILPNAIDTHFWRVSAPRVRQPEIHFVCAMRLSRKKRPHALVRAFAEASRFVAGAPALRLTLAGDGPDRESTARLAAELGVADRVELPGQCSREELRALYARADAFVLPSERESFGIAALEARAAGLPVIAMLAGGARDFIAQGVNGLLARDESELARFIARLALDEPFRRFIANRNASEPPPYDWSDVVRTHRVIYDVAAELREKSARRSQA
jgi:glycosyltransferase involved in cell wall biosynthesis